LYVYKGAELKIGRVVRGVLQILFHGRESEYFRHALAIRLGRIVTRLLVRSEDEPATKYMLAESISASIYPEYKFSEFGRTYLESRNFIDEYLKFEHGNNWHSLDRKFLLKELLRLTDQIQGDTAECGVFKGASSYFICKHIHGTSKKHHIFDSFEGLSSPCCSDGDYWQVGALACPESEVRANLAEFDNTIFHKGWIPSRFHEVADLPFSFVHIDVDLYEPTLDSIEFFYKHLSLGGILLCDDYGFKTCPGAREAMDEYFKTKPEPIIQSPTGQAFIIKIMSQLESQV
jgi:O-methyltransferase